MAIWIYLVFISKTFPIVPTDGGIISHVNVQAMLISMMTMTMDQKDKLMLQGESSDLASLPPN